MPAAAQTTVFGGPTSPGVIVNEDVIESLGPPQTLPGLLRSENAADANPVGLRPFTLHPPRAHRTAAVPKAKPQAEDQAQQTESATPSPQVAAAPTTARPQRATKGKREAVAQTRRQTPAAIPSKQRSAKSSRPQSLQQASLPTAAPPQAAATPSAPAPQPAAAPPPEPVPAPSGPVPSIVRRYPAGTGAAMLAGSSQRPSSAPAPAPQASTTSPPAPQTAAAPPPVSAPPSAAPAPSPSPAPATQSTPESAAASAPTPAPAPSAVSAPAPATQVASTGPTPAPSAQPAPQVAALRPQGGLPALPTQVVFAPNVTDMPDQAKVTLDKVISTMKADEQVRIQLAAYASGLPDQANQARRVSLSRAIGVRSYLIEQGIKSARIDVRALGNRSDSGGPPDRVDIVAIDR